jgi:hypothetical protein
MLLRTKKKQKKKFIFFVHGCCHLPSSQFVFCFLTPEFLSLYNTYKLQTERRALSDLSLSSTVHSIIIFFSFINFSVENMEYVVESYWEKMFFFFFFFLSSQYYVGLNAIFSKRITKTTGLQRD